MKILHCIHSLSGGGAEQQLTLLVNHQMGTDVTAGIFCVNTANHNIDASICKIFQIRNLRNYPFGLTKEISTVIDDFNPDIVHTWLPPSVSSPALIAAKIKKKITVASYRNKKRFDSWKRIPEFITTAFLADAIVSNNPPEQSSYPFRKLFYTKKHSTIIQNAVSVPEKFIKNICRSSDQKLRILFVGRLTQQKNWQTLLHSLSDQNNQENWELTICGTGEDSNKLKQLAKDLGIYQNIKMRGYEKNVYSVMSNSDVLILPSWYEGMPNVVLEAMALGLPCIISNIPAHTFLINGDSGIMDFAPFNVDALTEIISNILQNTMDLALASKRGLRFSKQYTPHAMVLKYNYFYKSLENKSNDPSNNETC